MALVLILLAGIAIRYLYLVELKNAPDFSLPQIDAGFHDVWAKGLATGIWLTPDGEADPMIRTAPYFRPPGYPWFLSIIYRFSGVDYTMPRIAQMCLGVLSVLIAFLIGRRWFTTRIGLVWSALMTCYWPLVYFEGELHAPALLVILLLLLLWLAGDWLERASITRALCTGFLLGVTCIVRPNFLLLIPLLVVWMYWGRRSGIANHVARRSALCMVLGALMAISPATIRNIVVADEFVPITANLGVNLYIGNNENADGFIADQIEGLGPYRTCYDYPAIVANLERIEGEPFKYRQASAWFVEQASRWIREHPAEWLRFTLKKAKLFWSPRELSHNKVIEDERRFSTILRWMPLGFPLLAVLAFVGIPLFIVDLKNKRIAADKVQIAGFMFFVILTCFVSVLPFFVAARYRIPAVPFLLFFAAWFVVRFYEFIMNGEVKRCLVWGTIAVALFWVLQPANQSNLPSAKWFFDRGVALSEQGRWDEAIVEYENAISIQPDYSQAFNNMGLVKSRMGNMGMAEKDFRTALKINSEYIEAQLNLGHLLVARRKPELALKQFEKALALNPSNVKALNFTGEALARLGRYDEAVNYFDKALQINPYSDAAHVNWGMTLTLMNDMAGAIQHYRMAIALNPQNAVAHDNLGVALAQKNQFSKAVEHFRVALSLKPDFHAAATHLEMALESERLVNQ